jgi:phosphatidate phosphatase APP1
MPCSLPAAVGANVADISGDATHVTAVMSDWSPEIQFLSRKLGMVAANAVRAVRTAMESDPFELLMYRGYGNGVRAHVYGRVVERTGVTPSQDGDTVLTNLLNTWRRAESDPLPGAQVTVSFGGAKTAMTADREGYFGGWVTSEPADRTDEWHDYEASLDPGQPGAAEDIKGKGQVLVPPQSARFAVISDIDDTVIQSRVSNFIQAARTVMLGNARTRLPFPGVAAFYEALRNGVGGSEHNPVFYVSSSPWNIYDVISEFMELQGIPKGPLLLRDWDLSLSSLASSRHFEHKGLAIRNVMQLYPDLPFILIGDTSQHDPEIYARIVAEFPDRVRAIYIRDVTRNPERSRTVQALAEEVLAANSTLVVSEDTMGAARHAAEHGWISPDSLPRVGEEKRADEGVDDSKTAVAGGGQAGTDAPPLVVEK